MLIITTLLACTLLWGTLAVCQFLQIGNFKIAVPQRLAKIFGSRTNYLDAGLFSLQIFSLLVFLWSIPVNLMYPQEIYRGFVFWRGVFFLLVGVSALFAILAYSSMKNRS